MMAENPIVKGKVKKMFRRQKIIVRNIQIKNKQTNNIEPKAVLKYNSIIMMELKVKFKKKKMCKSHKRCSI